MLHSSKTNHDSFFACVSRVMQPAALAAIRAAADAASAVSLLADPRRTLREALYVLVRDGARAAAGA